MIHHHSLGYHLIIEIEFEVLFMDDMSEKNAQKMHVLFVTIVNHGMGI